MLRDGNILNVILILFRASTGERWESICALSRRRQQKHYNRFSILTKIQKVPPAFRISHLITHNRWSLKECFEYVQQRRAEVAPNRGFWKQLMALEMRELGTQSIFDADLEVGINFTYLNNKLSSFLANTLSNDE